MSIMQAVFFSVLLWPGLSFAASDPPGRTQTSTGNVYVSGDEVLVRTPVTSDLFAAGRTVIVEQTIGADAALAGQTVGIQSDIGQDLRVAGAEVRIAGDIGGDLLAAGRSVQLQEQATVRGESVIIGGDVLLDGTLAQAARIYARRVVLSGRIDGRTRIYSPQIEFSPQARIHGDLVYASSSELTLEQRAQVSGEVVREKTPDAWRSDQPDDRGNGFSVHPGFFLSMLVCGSLLYLVFPNAVTGACQTIRTQPLRSLLLGLALLFTLPPLAVLFLVTLVGIPIGIGLLMLYPILLLLGYLATAFFLGSAAARLLGMSQVAARPRQILLLALALLALWLLAMIPVIGAATFLLAVVSGCGAWGLWLYQRYRHGDGEQERVPG